MQELIWFLLGVAVCSISVRLTLLMHKIYLLSQFKHYAFQLIYYSYQQLIFSTVSKYILLENNEDVSKEHIKVMKNEDSIFINEWKKSVSEGLKTQLPKTLRPALKYDSWDGILDQISSKFIKCIEKDFEKELEKLKRRINKNEDEQKKDSINLMDLQVPQGPPPLRTIGLFGDLDEEKVEDVCSGLLYLRHTSCLLMPGDNPEEEIKPKPVTFYVSTWGGDALGMFGIYDLMRMVREDCPIHTHGIGKVMSAGVLLLAAGTKGQRKIGKHCRIMMHAVRGGHMGSIHSLENEMEETRWIQKQHIKALCEETDLTERQLKNMLNKNMDVYLSAEDAVNYGIADIIV